MYMVYSRQGCGDFGAGRLTLRISQVVAWHSPIDESGNVERFWKHFCGHEEDVDSSSMSCLVLPKLIPETHKWLRIVGLMFSGSNQPSVCISTDGSWGIVDATDPSGDGRTGVLKPDRELWDAEGEANVSDMEFNGAILRSVRWAEVGPGEATELNGRLVLAKGFMESGLGRVGWG